MPYDDFNWITDTLAVGAFVTEPGTYPFDAILSMEIQAPLTLRGLLESGAVEYQWQSIIDGYCAESHDAIVARFNAAADQLHAWQASGKKALVHCFAGVSRAVTAAAWYLVRYEGYSWDDAVAAIQRERPQANPNIRFEIPLRLAAGEHLSEEWIEQRIANYCKRLNTEYGSNLQPAEIRQHLAEQGTLDRVLATR